MKFNASVIEVKSYTLHSVSGIDYKHYKHPLPATVYHIYIKYWTGVSFKT